MLRTRMFRLAAVAVATLALGMGAAAADPAPAAPPAHLLSALQANGQTAAHFPEARYGALPDDRFRLPQPYAFAGVPAWGKAILVNIPSAELIAFENGQPVLRSRVIVGKPATPTPIMRTETSVVRFRPTWTPTPRMVRSGKYRPGTRPPGKRNPLGYLAIRLAPGMLIYLHGTNKPHLFERERRALSHGCVRVDKWKEVAAWVLGTDIAEVERRAFGRRTHDVDTGGVPVIMGYWTEFPDAEGQIQSYRDVYRRGRRGPTEAVSALR